MPTNKPGKRDGGQEGMACVRMLGDCLVFGTAIIDSNGPTIICDDPAEEMLGLPSASGRPIPLDSLPAPLPETIRQFLSSTGRADSRQLELAHPNRGMVTLSLRFLALAGKPDRAAHVLVLRDLSPFKKIEQMIWRLDRLASLGTLSASMAHEIKNALVAGRTFIDLLLEKNPEAELVDIVRREMGRIDSIVSRMLNFVGPARSVFAPVNLHESLDHSLRLVQPQMEAKTISLNRSFSASPEVVHGDDHELQQAFVNLFLNALEAMEVNGTLTVATEMIPLNAATNGRPSNSAPQIRVTIKDTGSGINSANIERLFEPFFTTKSAGTGLGLPITQRIIQEHRGAIEVQSQPGEGTTFNIIFPALRKAE